MKTIIIYLLLGMLWSAILEWYTTNYTQDLQPEKWTWGERFWNILIWPLALGIFVYSYFNNRD